MVVQNGFVVSVFRVFREKLETTKKPEAYRLRYAEDFFVRSNEVAVKLSNCRTANNFSPLCECLHRFEANVISLRINRRDLKCDALSDLHRPGRFHKYSDIYFIKLNEGRLRILANNGSLKGLPFRPLL